MARILIIDDDCDFLKVMEVYLGDFNHEVATLTQGNTVIRETGSRDHGHYDARDNGRRHLQHHSPEVRSRLAPHRLQRHQNALALSQRPSARALPEASGFPLAGENDRSPAIARKAPDARDGGRGRRREAELSNCPIAAVRNKRRESTLPTHKISATGPPFHKKRALWLPQRR
jgi:hypothetical protein